MIESDNRLLSERAGAAASIYDDSESARGGRGEEKKREIDEGSCLGPPPRHPAGSTVSCRCGFPCDVARLFFVYILELM